MSKSEDISYSVLNFDHPLKMEGSLAEAFFLKHFKTFGAWNGKHVVNSKLAERMDSQKNKVYDQVEFLEGILKNQNIVATPWSTTSLSDKSKVLFKIASKLDESSKLICQIEYFLRNKSQNDTKKYVTQIANYFRFYALNNNPKKEGKTPKDPCILLLKDVSSILELAITAQCFASGRCVKIIVEKNVSALGILFGEIFQEAGILPGLFVICPIGKYTSEDIEKMSSTSITQPFFKTNANGGSCMAVMEVSDIDSAVDLIPDAAWLENGLSPWTLKKIIVQENIYEKFKEKLSQKISKDYSNFICTPDKYVESETQQKIKESVKNVLAKVSQQGIKFVGMDLIESKIKDGEYVGPIILLDNVPPYFWTDLPDNIPVPVVTVQTFRTTKEAISIINNFSSFALSLWCNNISICNELALASNVSCVWINAFALMSAEIAIKDKHFPNSHFVGGHEGFYASLSEEIFEKVDYPDNRKMELAVNSVKLNSEMVEKASKLQLAWSMSSNEKKISCLLRVLDSLENDKAKWISLQNSETHAHEMLDKAAKYINFAVDILRELRDGCSIIMNRTMCLSIREALGVIFVDDNTNHIHRFVYTVVATILFGNAVIYKANSSLAVQVCKMFSDAGIPVLSVTESYNFKPKYEMIRALWRIGHEDYATFLKENASHDTIIWSESKDNNFNVHDEMLLKIRFSNVKSIWSTFGETFAN